MCCPTQTAATAAFTALSPLRVPPLDLTALDRPQRPARRTCYDSERHTRHRHTRPLSARSEAGRRPLSPRPVNLVVCATAEAGSPGELLELGKRLSRSNEFDEALSWVNKSESKLRAREQRPDWGTKPKSTREHFAGSMLYAAVRAGQMRRRA